MTVVLMPRMQTSRAYEFMGVNPPSFPSIPPHENAALILPFGSCATKNESMTVFFIRPWCLVSDMKINYVFNYNSHWVVLKNCFLIQ